MADPVTIGMALSAGGSLINAYGKASSGESTASMYQYQAGVAQMNKKIALQNADYARVTGEVEAQGSGMKTRALVGEIKAHQGASNIDVNSGSGVAVRDSQLEVGYQNQSIIRSNAARKAYGYEVEAAQAESQSQIYTMAARGSKTGGYIGAISSLIGGAGSVADKWYQYGSKYGDSGAGGNPGPYESPVYDV